MASLAGLRLLTDGGAAFLESLDLVSASFFTLFMSFGAEKDLAVLVPILRAATGSGLVTMGAFLVDLLAICLLLLSVAIIAVLTVTGVGVIGFLGTTLAGECFFDGLVVLGGEANLLDLIGGGVTFLVFKGDDLDSN